MNKWKRRYKRAMNALFNCDTCANNRLFELDSLRNSIDDMAVDIGKKDDEIARLNLLVAEQVEKTYKYWDALRCRNIEYDADIAKLDRWVDNLIVDGSYLYRQISNGRADVAKSNWRELLDSIAKGRQRIDSIDEQRSRNLEHHIAKFPKESE